MADDRQFKQTAPWPHELEEIVHQLIYRPGWTIELLELERDPGSAGLTLVVTTSGFDSYHVDRGPTYRVHHYFPVPPATFKREDWRRWVFDRLVDIERHETAEFFVVDGARPYAPNHGPGRNPYTLVEYRDDVDRRTRFTVEVVEVPLVERPRPHADSCNIQPHPYRDCGRIAEVAAGIKWLDRPHLEHCELPPEDGHDDCLIPEPAGVRSGS